MDCSHLVAQCTEIINLIDSKYSNSCLSSQVAVLTYFFTD
jgi:hypothetical protein